MRSRLGRIAAIASLALTAGLFVPGAAQAAATYEIQVGQGFFEKGVPGFSARFYPGSVKVHSGDTIHFDNSSAAQLPVGQYPQEFIGSQVNEIDDPWFFLASDPDDGPKATKINPAFFDESSDCGTEANPCVWSDTNQDLVFGGEEDLYVEVQGLPGSVLWAASIPGSDANVNLRVEIVGPQDAASDQAALDARAAALKSKDFEDALALHNRMSGKKSSHVNGAGQRVFDVFVGAAAGPIELLASYPKRLAIRRGQKVQFHYMDQLEPHTATFGGSVAKEVFQMGFMPVCDPDGDEGTTPDTQAQFEDENAPPCVDMSQFEVDIDDRIPWETGDRKVTANNDYENSGLKFPQFPDEGSFDASPWTAKFPKASNKKGFKFICLVHGGFMGGRVVVR